MNELSAIMLRLYHASKYDRNVTNCMERGHANVVVSGVRRMNEVNVRRTRLVLGWVTVFGRYTISVCNKPTTVGQLSIASLRGS